MFADNTSILVTNPNPVAFVNDINAVFKCINKWFKANLLLLNFNKTNFIYFIPNSKPIIYININYNNMQITAITNTKFLGILITDSLSWKTHADYIIPKLSTACYAMRIIKPYMSQNTFKKGLFLLFPFYHKLWSTIFGKHILQYENL
jgi:hypothetical protein